MSDTKQAVDAPLQTPVRLPRWVCQSCGWVGDDHELLRATSPFDADDVICACPECKTVEDVLNACDEPGCNRDAGCGFPSPTGYRRTCMEHANL